MGLFKRIFSGAKNRDDVSSANGPRCDHYTFTHVVLRQAAFENPAHAVTVLASPDASEMLNGLWHAVLTRCAEHNQPATLDPADILIHKLRVGSYPCTLFEMPTPATPTEAFLVAMVLTIDLANSDRGFETTPIRYFTLEMSESEGDEIKTVIGEWFADESHQTHGADPEPSVENFVAAITKLATQRKVE